MVLQCGLQPEMERDILDSFLKAYAEDMMSRKTFDETIKRMLNQLGLDESATKLDVFPRVAMAEPMIIKPEPGAWHRGN